MIRLCSLIAAVGVSAVVHAAPACAPPTQEAVCESGKVSKPKLANYVLDSCGVSRNLEASFASSGGLALPQAQEDELVRNKATLTSGERMLVLMPCAGGSCGEADAKALSAAGGLFDYMLNYAAPAFRNASAETMVPGFLLASQAVLACGSDADNKPIEAPGAVAGKPPELPTRLRVRGSTDSLFWSNKDAAFSSSDKGSLGSTYGSSNTTRTDKILAVVGYALRDPINNPPYNVFPYVAVNRNLSRPTGKDVAVNSNTVSFGFLNSYYRQSGEVTHWFTLRPDLLVNHKDDSHLVSANFIYTPFKNYESGSWYVNDFRYRGLFGGRASFQPIADLRLNYGHYTQDGNVATSDYSDYWRVGPRVGFSIASESPLLPLDFTVTNLYLEGLKGEVEHVNYFKAVLSYKLVGKFVGIDLSYGHGRREDTAQFEHVWGVALAGAY
jgi:hypothetical protein